MTDEELKALCQEIVDAHPKKLKEYYDGNTGIFGGFVGTIFQKSRGLADPQKVVNILKEILKPEQKSTQ